MLTRYEALVVALVADGKTNKEIAADFGANESAIKQAVWRICNKLGCQNRVQLAVWFANIGRPNL